MIIKEIQSQQDKIKYSEIATEAGNIFNTPDWLNIFGNRLKLFGIYENDNRLIGGFALYKDQKFGFNVYRNPPLTHYIGPFFQMSNNLNKQREGLILLADYVNRLPYAIVSFFLNKNIIDTLPFVWGKFKVVPHYTYVINLGTSTENIFKNMSKERRNDLNKAIKDELVVERINDFSLIKYMILKTFSRQKKTINQFYLDKILFHFANSNNSFAFAVTRNSKPIAASFCLYDKHSAYYLLGGYDKENKHHGASALSLWEAIKYAKELGLQDFDFAGSMVPQIERFFRDFGGELTPYYRINKAKLPLEIILKFFKREIF